MKRTHFKTLDNIEASTTGVIKNITAKDFLGAYEALKLHWKKCIDAEGHTLKKFKLLYISDQQLKKKKVTLLLVQTLYMIL